MSDTHQVCISSNSSLYNTGGGGGGGTTTILQIKKQARVPGPWSNSNKSHSFKTVILMPTYLISRM